MLVDYEQAWLSLKAATVGKQGIGVSALHALMAELEVQHRVEEGTPERALRLYGVGLSHDLIIGGDESAPREAQAPLLDDEDAAPSDPDRVEGARSHGRSTSSRQEPVVA